jgi:hypothetical protein
MGSKHSHRHTDIHTYIHSHLNSHTHTHTHTHKTYAQIGPGGVNVGEGAGGVRGRCFSEAMHGPFDVSALGEDVTVVEEDLCVCVCLCV